MGVQIIAWVIAAVGTLTDALHIDQNRLFVGNYHFPILEAFTELVKL